MSIKDVEQRGAEVDGAFFPNDPRLLAQREVLITTTKSPSSGKRPRFIAKREGGRNSESRGIPEGRIRRVEIGLVGFVYAGDDINSSDSCEVAPCKQDIASGAATRAINCRWRPRFVAGDT